MLRAAGRWWAGLWVRLCSGSDADTLQTPDDRFPPAQSGGVWEVYGAGLNSTAYSNRERSLRARAVNLAARGSMGNNGENRKQTEGKTQGKRYGSGILSRLPNVLSEERGECRRITINSL